MSTKWIIFFCIEVFVRLGDAIVSNKEIFHGMSVNDRKLFFGTDDGSVPEIQLVELPKKSRSKRSYDLNVPFEYHGVRTVANLYFIPDDDLISQTSTGIWLAQTNNFSHHDVFYTPKPDIFDDVGPFYLFQNQDECSAIAQFVRPSGGIVMIGVLMQDYTVRNLPQEYDHGYTYINSTHSIHTRSVDTTSDQDSPLYLVIFESPKPPQEYFRRPNRTASLADHDLNRRRRQSVQGGRQPPPFNPPKVVYPKLLISPDYGVVSAEKSVADFLMFFIAHANAIDMMYRQLRDPDVRLKIGGIIIPQDPGATPYIARDTQKVSYIVADDVLYSARAFFGNEFNRFKADTYSAVLILTNNVLYAQGNGPGKYINIAGRAMDGSCCDWGPAMVKYSRGFRGVLAMAHELGHLFTAVHDGPICSNDGGYTMVPGVNLARVLKWSACSKLDFQRFFKSRTAKCTHSPPPVFSSLEGSMPGSWMSLEGQCDNEMKNTIGVCFDSSAECKKFPCTKLNSCCWSSRPPFEGTLREDGKRCMFQMWLNT